MKGIAVTLCAMFMLLTAVVFCVESYAYRGSFQHSEVYRYNGFQLRLSEYHQSQDNLGLISHLKYEYVERMRKCWREIDNENSEVLLACDDSNVLEARILRALGVALPTPH